MEGSPVHHPKRVNLKRSHQKLQLCVLTDINRLIELIFSQYIQTPIIMLDP